MRTRWLLRDLPSVAVTCVLCGRTFEAPRLVTLSRTTPRDRIRRNLRAHMDSWHRATGVRDRSVAMDAACMEAGYP